MRIPSTQHDCPTLYLRYPKAWKRQCPVCGSPVADVFPDNGRVIHTLTGTRQIIRYLYICTNDQCWCSEKAFCPYPPSALPYKRYGLDVWKIVIELALTQNHCASDISKTLKTCYHLKVGVSVVRSMIKDFDLLSKPFIEAESLRLIRQIGCAIIMLDGQRPEMNQKSLWLFTDAITGRVVYACLLSLADYETLGEILIGIQQWLGVPIVGFVSDHQASVLKTCEQYFPGVPHQYCQFHFLQNLWRPLEQKSTHLHKALEKIICHLHINSVAREVTVKYDDVGECRVREVFSGVEAELRTLLHTQDNKFSAFAGLETYELLAAWVYQAKLDASCLSPLTRIGKQLFSTIQKLESALAEYFLDYSQLLENLYQIQELEVILYNPEYDKQEARERCDHFFTHQWQTIPKEERTEPRRALKQAKLDIDTTETEIHKEWVRLYDSHKDGLFCCYDFPYMIRTNIYEERCFSMENRSFRRSTGRSQIGEQVRRHGATRLVQQHSNIIYQIEPVLRTYTILEIQRLRTVQAKVDAEETQHRHHAHVYWTAVVSVLNQYNKPKKRVG